MFHLIPAPLHRLALRLAYRLRGRWRRLTGLRHDGISLVMIDHRERVLLVRHSYGSSRWSLPGGGLKRGEDPEQCARREMREELGAELATIEFFEENERVIQGAPNLSHVFTARLAGELRIDGREVIDFGWFAPDDLPEDMIELARNQVERWAARYSRDS